MKYACVCPIGNLFFLTVKLWCLSVVVKKTKSQSPERELAERIFPRTHIIRLLSI